jgi:outer membrane protein assembly factor BamB
MVSDVPVGELRLGQNGDVYLVELRNNYSCLVCLTDDGFFKWKFAPDGGISQLLVLNDGTVIARNTVSIWNNTYNTFGGIIKMADNLTAISDEGSILWQKDILVKTDMSESLNGPFLGRTPPSIFI